MIERLVVLGGTGDLMGRYLLPALAALHARERLPAGFEVVGAARDELDDEQFRSWAGDWLEREAADVDPAARDAVVGALRYRRIDFGDPASVEACTAGGGPVAVYLALPPAVFSTAVSVLHRTGLPADSPVVLENR